MTLRKLSRRNAKRQASDYLIYFVTIVMVCAMLYAFNALIFTDEIKQLSALMSNLTITIVLASVVVVFIIGWLVAYSTGFMLSRRSRELGTYLLIGLENKQVARLFLLENLAVGAVALVFGIPLGNLLFQVLKAILLTMFSTPYRFSYVFSLKAIGITLLYLILIYFFALRRSRKRIRKMKIYDLIYFDRQNESEIVKKGKTRRFMFGFSIVLGIAGVLLLFLRQFVLGVIGAACVIAFLYCFFLSFSSGVPAFFDNKPERKFRGQNLLIFRTLTSKLATMGMVMATISLLFTATLFTEELGLVFNGIFNGRVERNSFDLLYVTDDESRRDSRLEYVQELVKLTEVWEYNLYLGPDSGIADYLVKNTDFLLFSYDHDYNSGAMIGFSDYAALRDMLGYPKVEMELGTYIIHCMPYLKDAFSKWDEPMSTSAGNLMPGEIYTEEFCQNLWNGNGHQFLIVVPDEVCENRPCVRYIFAAMTAQTLTQEQYDDIFYSDGKVIDGLSTASSDWDLLHSKANAIAEAVSWSAMIVFPLFYLALTLAMTAVTILTIQQLSEAGRYRRQFELLRKLGMSSQDMSRALFRQFAIYYALPVIPAVLVAVPFIPSLTGAVEPGTMVGSSSSPVIIAVTLGLFFLIYFIYIVIAYTSMKRNVLAA